MQQTQFPFHKLFDFKTTTGLNDYITLHVIQHASSLVLINNARNGTTDHEVNMLILKNWFYGTVADAFHFETWLAVLNSNLRSRGYDEGFIARSVYFNIEPVQIEKDAMECYRIYHKVVVGKYIFSHSLEVVKYVPMNHVLTCEIKT